MSGRWRKAVAAIGAFWFPTTVATALEVDTIGATSHVARCMSAGLPEWYSSLNRFWRGLSDIDPPSAATTGEPDESLPEMPPIAVPRSNRPAAAESASDSDSAGTAQTPDLEADATGATDGGEMQKDETPVPSEAPAPVQLNGAIEPVADDRASSDELDLTPRQDGPPAESSGPQPENGALPNATDSDDAETRDSQPFDTDRPIHPFFSPFDGPIGKSPRGSVWM